MAFFWSSHRLDCPKLSQKEAEEERCFSHKERVTKYRHPLGAEGDFS